MAPLKISSAANLAALSVLGNIMTPSISTSSISFLKPLKLTGLCVNGALILRDSYSATFINATCLSNKKSKKRQREDFAIMNVKRLSQ